MKKIKVKEGHPFLQAGFEATTDSKLDEFCNLISGEHFDGLKISERHVTAYPEYFEEIPQRIALDVTHIVNNEGNHGYEISRKDNKRLEISDFHKFEQAINGELKSKEQALEYADGNYNEFEGGESEIVANFIEEFFPK